MIGSNHQADAEKQRGAQLQGPIADDRFAGDGHVMPPVFLSHPR
jgi:hypothetical protein